MSSSPLRQLARDYYDGRIERADYLGQRRELLNELFAQGSAQSASPVAPESGNSGLFQTLEVAQPDSNDLAQAFANRNSASSVEPEASAPVAAIVPASDGALAGEESELATERPKKSSRPKVLVLLLAGLVAWVLWRLQLSELLSQFNFPF